MYIYESHMGGLFVSDDVLDYEQTYLKSAEILIISSDMQKQ